MTAPTTEPPPTPRSTNPLDEPKICPTCGASLRPDAKYCNRCGTRLIPDMDATPRVSLSLDWLKPTYLPKLAPPALRRRAARQVWLLIGALLLLAGILVITLVLVR